MKTLKRHSIKLYLALAVAGLVTLYMWPSLVAAMPLTAKQQLDRAWQLALDVGSYAYRTDVTQTSYPTAKLENSGRSPQIQKMRLEGQIDRPNNTMTMQITAGPGQQPVELKVENGTAYGRAGTNQEWIEVDNPADIFAPNGDPLGFLVALENIEEVGSKEYGAGGETAGPPSPYFLLPASYSHYTFDINSNKYAEYMREQMEAALRAQGELPPGVRLEILEQYAQMKAHGEIWLNDSGVPVRQVIHMEFPPERDAYNRIEADITTTFSRWDTASLEHQLFWAIPRLVDDPSVLTKDPLSLLPTPPTLSTGDVKNLQKFGFLLGLGLLLLALAVITITHGKSPKFYGAVAASVLVLMLVTPLMQSNQIYAYSERQHTRQVEQEQQNTNRQAADQLQSDMQSSDFNPRVSPLAQVNPPP